MQRRNILKLMGVLGGGAAVVTGTGAFTSVTADRDVTIQVADDDNAMLAIDDTGNANAAYTTETNGELGIDLTGDNSTGAGGQGVNTDAVTVIQDLFQVQNQGSQSADVEVTPLTFVENSSGSGNLLVMIVPQTAFPSVELGPGETETYDMIVDVVPDASALEVESTMTITGEAV